MGRRRSRVLRIGRQTTTRRHTTRKPTPPPGIDRSRQGRVTNQRHLPVSPLQPHHPPTRTQQSRRGHRSHHPRVGLAHGGHRRDLHRPRRRLLHQATRPRPARQPTHPTTRNRGLHRHAHPSRLNPTTPDASGLRPDHQPARPTPTSEELISPQYTRSLERRTGRCVGGLPGHGPARCAFGSWSAALRETPVEATLETRWFNLVETQTTEPL